MTTTHLDQDIDLDLDERDLAGLTSAELVIADPVRYIHTRWPSDASLVANGAVTVMALLGAGALVAGFTGRLEVESPVTAVLIVLMYALAWVAVRARRNAEAHAFTVEDLP